MHNKLEVYQWGRAGRTNHFNWTFLPGFLDNANKFRLYFGICVPCLGFLMEPRLSLDCFLRHFLNLLSQPDSYKKKNVMENGRQS